MLEDEQKLEEERKKKQRKKEGRKVRGGNKREGPSIQGQDRDRDQARDEETARGEDGGEGGNSSERHKECIIKRTFKRKKAQLLSGGSGSGGDGNTRERERRPSTEISTEHVEDRLADPSHQQSTGTTIESRAETRGEENTTNIPRRVLSNGAENKDTGHESSRAPKPSGLLATLLSGESEPFEGSIGSLPFEIGHDEEEEEEDEYYSEDAEFSEFVRVRSNLAQSTAANLNTNMKSTSSSSSSCSRSRRNRTTVVVSDRGGGGGHVLLSPPLPASSLTTSSHEFAYVDLKDINTSSIKQHLDYNKERNEKRQREERHRSRNENNPKRNDGLLSPSPVHVPFRLPIWRDDDENFLKGEENSASDLMDIMFLTCSSSSDSTEPSSDPDSNSSPSLEDGSHEPPTLANTSTTSEVETTPSRPRENTTKSRDGALVVYISSIHDVDINVTDNSSMSSPNKCPN